MSGSNSSNPIAVGAAREPLTLTVHSMPEVDLSTEARRTRVGRWKMLAVLLVCASPVIASYFTYFFIRPDGRTHVGELIVPPREIPSLTLRTLDGQPVEPASLKGQWLLVALGGGACEAECEQRLYLQRQLREMTGRERDRIDKVWLLLDDVPLRPALAQAVQAAPAVQVLRADAAQVAAWLQPAPGESLDAALYLVDPMGQWMMRLPARPDPQKARKDLDRLLRAAASWDRPGR